MSAGSLASRPRKAKNGVSPVDSFTFELYVSSRAGNCLFQSMPSSHFQLGQQLFHQFAHKLFPAVGVDHQGVAKPADIFLHEGLDHIVGLFGLHWGQAYVSAEPIRQREIVCEQMYIFRKE